MTATCRICLRSNQTIVSHLKNCVNIIKDVAQIDICLDQKLPNMICAECVERLLDARTIKEMCIKSENYFTKMLNQNEATEKFIEKVEVKEENEYEEVEFLIDEKIEWPCSEQLTFRCCICNEYLADESLLKEHCLKEHKWRINCSASDLSELQCLVCKCNFDESKFLTHSYQILYAMKQEFVDKLEENSKTESINKNSATKITNVLDNNCCQCSKKFTELNLAREHFKQNHPDYNPKALKNSNEKFKCKICLATFPSTEELAAHGAEQKQPFSCAKCDRKLNKIGDIKLHYEKKHPGIPPLYKCNQCERTYEKYSSFYSHLYKFHQHDFRQNICDMCGKIFVDPFYLQNHVDTHHYEIKNFICDLCSKAFSTKSSLRSHMRSHTGEKPYKCPHCTKCYGFYTDWKTHIASKHTGVWRLHCTQCNRGFMKPSQLKIHQKTHANLH